MSTIRQVIDTSLRMIGVLDADEPANAEDAALCLREMNNLMEQLAGDGVDLDYPPQDDVSNDFPLDSRVEAQFTPIFAASLLTFYPAAKPPITLAGRAESAMNRLRLDAVLDRIEEASMSNIPLGSANRYGYNIETGE